VQKQKKHIGDPEHYATDQATPRILTEPIESNKKQLTHLLAGILPLGLFCVWNNYEAIVRYF
jgi:hypothetical protein